MATIRETIDVDRPAADVFDAIADFSTTEQWDPGVARARQVAPADDGGLRPSGGKSSNGSVTTAPGIGVGSAFDVDLDVPGLPLQPTYRYTIRTYDRPHRLVLTTRSAVAEGRDDVTVLDRGERGCTVVWEATFRLRGPGALVDPLLAIGFRRVGRRAVEGLASWLRDGGTGRSAA